VPNFADRGFHMVSVRDPNGRILRFLDRSCYFYQVAPQLENPFQMTLPINKINQREVETIIYHMALVQKRRQDMNSSLAKYSKTYPIKD
jgi:hypothetical protein